MSDSNYWIDSPRRQYFSLPYNLICFIIEKPSSPKGFLRLQQTCKYFFSKNKIVISHQSFKYYTSELFYFKNIFGFEDYSLPWKGRQLWPIKRFTIMGSISIPKNIYRYDFIVELFIEYTVLSSNEIHILFSSKKLKSLVWSYVDIENDTDADTVSFTIADILSQVPTTTITKFSYGNPSEIYTNETFQKLNILNFSKKFELFCIYDFAVNNEMNPKDFCNFIKKNINSKSRFKYVFPENARRNDFWGLKAAKDKILWDWPEQSEKPEIIFEFHS